MARYRLVSRISSAEVVDLWLVACYVEIVYAFGGPPPAFCGLPTYTIAWHLQFSDSLTKSSGTKDQAETESPYQFCFFIWYNAMSTWSPCLNVTKDILAAF